MKCARENCSRLALRHSKLCEQHQQLARNMGLVGRFPVARAKAHVDLLMDAGWGKQDIANAAGLAYRSMRSILYGGRIYPSTERKILALRPEDSPDTSLLRRDPTGFIRRAEALSWLGYPSRFYSDRLGCHPRTVPNIKLRGSVTTGMHNRMVRIYDELSGTPGPCRVTAGTARGRGFLPPLCWDDNIDDPNAEPAGVRRNKDRRTGADLLAEYDHFKYLGLSDVAVADRLGIKLDSLHQAISRARKQAA